jgi:pyruvate,orthophosphate dikinase
MIPMVGFLPELRAQAQIVHETAQRVFQETSVTIRYLVGAMIELPRACLLADQIAKEAQFFTFSTNDPTQTCLGMSRDDYGSFFRHYTEQGILARDPFHTLDQDGVGTLMRLAVGQGRAVRPDLKIGICGEHGGDPDTIRFCHDIGLDYVSASPFRVPIARLSAGQAAFHTMPTAS